MDVVSLDYSKDDRLKTLLEICKSGDRCHEVGTGLLPKGGRMPETGRSAHTRHEVSLILDGKIITNSGGKEVVLRAGDIVSIPEGQHQNTQVMEETRLLYIFFDK